MAWVVVPGSNNIWEFDNSAVRADTYPDSPGTITGGVRTYTSPDGKDTQTYIKARKVGETAVRGEINKDYYDNLVP